MTTETTQARPRIPQLTCVSCGVVTGEPTDAAEVIAVPGAWQLPTSDPRHIPSLRCTRCPRCTALREAAEAITARYRGLAARIGNRATDQVEQALTALAVLDQPLPTPDTLTPRQAAALVHHLAGPGRALAWSRQAEARTTPAAPDPAARAWAHVGGDELAAVRSGYARMLRERTRPQRPPGAVGPPAIPPAHRGAVALPGACLLCGVGTVTVPGAQLDAPGGPDVAQSLAWRAMTASPAQLGGPTSATRVAGHVCPACSDAIDGARALGPSTRERAVLAHLTAAGRERDAERLRIVLAGDYVPTLPGWAAYAYVAREAGKPLPAANTSPWAHITQVGEGA